MKEKVLFWLKKMNENPKLFVAIVGTIIGMISFVIVYGCAILDFSYDDWLYRAGDLPQHYSGWMFFRNSSWHFPIGLIDGLVYPDLVSVMYTDSIPLFAIFFKIFSGILPDKFQYFGLWGIMSFGLMGALSSMLIYKLTGKSIYALLISVCFVLAAPVLHRMYYHTALAGQWIIILAFLIFMEQNTRKAFWWWLGTLTLAVYIHAYFVVMVGILMLAYWLRQWLLYGEWGKYAICSVIPILFGIFNLYLLGAFYGDVTKGAQLFGESSANLNTLFNPMGTSSILTNLQTATQWQYEGYGYLGIGIIILALLAIVFVLEKVFCDSDERTNILKNKKDVYLWISVFVCFWVIALSNRVSLGNEILFTVPIPKILEDFGAMFRSTGRFIWVPVYMVMVISAVGVAKYCRSKHLTVLLAVFCVFLQIVDIRGWFSSFYKQFNEKVVFSTGITQLFAGKAKEYKKIYILDDCDFVTLYSFAKVASENGMVLNDFYLARKNENNVLKYKEKLARDIDVNIIEKDAIYVTSNDKNKVLTIPNMAIYNTENKLFIAFKKS